MTGYRCWSFRTAAALLALGVYLGTLHPGVGPSIDSIELHTATLVHDDLIDGALLRRGNPTLNAEWSPAATILTGDFLLTTELADYLANVEVPAGSDLGFGRET